MTTFVNQDGGVSTPHAENVRAQDHVDGVPYVEWKRITGSSLIQLDRTIHCAQGQTGEIWFAFYQTPPPPNVALPGLIELMSAGIFLWTGDDTCGNGGHWVGPGHGGPGPGPGTFKITLAKNVRLNAEQKKQVEALAKAYPAAAQAGLTGMSKALDIITKINSIIGGKAQH